jgi:hypothetical protein
MNKIITLSIICFAFVIVGCGENRVDTSVTKTKSPVTVSSKIPIQEALIGTWSWDNQRSFYTLERKAPPENQIRHQTQVVTFSPDGRFLLHATLPDLPPFVWGGRWKLDAERKHVEVSMDDLPESPNAPKIGIKGVYTLHFHLDSELKQWILLRTMDAGYLIFLKSG